MINYTLLYALKVRIESHPSHRIKKEKQMEVKDSNGNLLVDGDSVLLIKDLKVKGTTVTLKRGTVAKNIRLTSNHDEVECNVEKVRGLVLKRFKALAL